MWTSMLFVVCHVSWICIMLGHEWVKNPTNLPSVFKLIYNCLLLMTCLLEQYLYGSHVHPSSLWIQHWLPLALEQSSCTFSVTCCWGATTVISWYGLLFLLAVRGQVLLLDFSTGTICNIHWRCICRVTNVSVTRFYSENFTTYIRTIC